MLWSWLLGITSPTSRDGVSEASFEPGVDAWICAGASVSKAGGMVMKRQQPVARMGKVEGKQEGILALCVDEEMRCDNDNAKAKKL